MNTKKILGVVAVLALVAVAMVGAGAASTGAVSLSGGSISTTQYYDTIADAYTALEKDAAQQTELTSYSIEVLADHNTAGFGNDKYGTSGVLTSRIKVTIDLNGHTVTFVNPAVGSVGYETQCIRNLSGNTMTLKSTGSQGIFTLPESNVVSTEEYFSMFIHNYGSMTIGNVVIDATNLQQAYYKSNGQTEAGDTYVIAGNDSTSGESLTLTDGAKINKINNTSIVNTQKVYGLELSGTGGVTVTGNVEVDGDLRFYDSTKKLTLGTDANLTVPGVDWSTVKSNIYSAAEDAVIATSDASKTFNVAYNSSTQGADIDSSVKDTPLSTGGETKVEASIGMKYYVYIPSGVTLGTSPVTADYKIKVINPVAGTDSRYVYMYPAKDLTGLSVKIMNGDTTVDSMSYTVALKDHSGTVTTTTPIVSAPVTSSDEKTGVLTYGAVDTTGHKAGSYSDTLTFTVKVETPAV